MTRIARKIRLALELRHVGRETSSVIIHDDRWVRRLPPWIVVPLLCGPVKGWLSCPSNLTIVLVHNHPYETVLERSLRYVGIENYAVVSVSADLPWRNTRKITAVLELLRGAADPTEFVLCCDADDCVIRDDPRKAIELLERNDCELLFSNYQAGGTYRFMPEVAAWLQRTAPAEIPGDRYLNAGVYVGRWGTVAEVLEAASEYIVADDDPDPPRNLLPGRYAKVLVTDRFPYGVAEQVIMRYLQPRFYPRMKTDFEARLALRSRHGIGQQVPSTHTLSAPHKPRAVSPAQHTATGQARI